MSASHYTKETEESGLVGEGVEWQSAYVRVVVTTTAVRMITMITRPATSMTLL